jgi:hypothetical protein
MSRRQRDYMYSDRIDWWLSGKLRFVLMNLLVYRPMVLFEEVVRPERWCLSGKLGASVVLDASLPDLIRQ